MVPIEILQGVPLESGPKAIPALLHCCGVIWCWDLLYNCVSQFSVSSWLISPRGTGWSQIEVVKWWHSDVSRPTCVFICYTFGATFKRTTLYVILNGFLQNLTGIFGFQTPKSNYLEFELQRWSNCLSSTLTRKSQRRSLEKIVENDPPNLREWQRRPSHRGTRPHNGKIWGTSKFPGLYDKWLPNRLPHSADYTTECDWQYFDSWRRDMGIEDLPIEHRRTHPPYRT